MTWKNYHYPIQGTLLPGEFSNSSLNRIAHRYIYIYLADKNDKIGFLGDLVKSLLQRQHLWQLLVLCFLWRPNTWLSIFRAFFLRSSVTSHLHECWRRSRLFSPSPKKTIILKFLTTRGKKILYFYFLSTTVRYA